MAHGAPADSAVAHAANTTPKASTPAQTESAQSRRDLASWWKGFKRGNQKGEDHKDQVGIFGVPLQQSIRYANVAISLFNEEGQSYIYGYVPIVVAKCGVFLKEKATDVEGIFRLAGSEKRIKELKIAFDSPDRYGKGLDWTGYTVHDAANILRRYFNQLPEPIIPLDFYERFRDPLRNHQQQAVGAMESQSPDQGSFNAEHAIRAYQALITELPPLNRQLLLYILDLLAVFASKADLNKMTTANLAAIFQPGLLSHPQHDMAPQEYRLSQDILIFLIENQDSFLVGMAGTAADEKTVKEVQSGVSSPIPGSPGTPSRSRTVIGRSNSNASAGADSVRKWGGIRRNLSVSSKRSREDSGSGQGGAGSPLLNSPVLSGSGMHRSNTVPSKRPGIASPRFTRERSSGPPTPSPTGTAIPPPLGTPHTGAQGLSTIPDLPQQSVTQTDRTPAPPDIISASSSEATTPLAAPGSDTTSAVLIPKDQYNARDTYGALAPPSSTRRDTSSERSVSQSSNSPRAFLDIFKPISGGEWDKKDVRQPRKLQKKRLPGSALSSAQSSVNDLQSADEQAISPVTPTFPRDVTDPISEPRHERSVYSTAQNTPRETTPHRTTTDTTLRPTSSPPRSLRSGTSMTDNSDTDFGEESAAATAEKQEKKHRWRFSHSIKHKSPERDAPKPMPTNIGSVTSREASRSTIASSNGGQGRAMQIPTDPAPPAAGNQMGASPPEAVMSDSEEKKKGPMSWIRGKIAERKEKEAEKRAKSPPINRGDGPGGESRASLHHGSERLASRGKSMDVSRGPSMVASSAEGEKGEGRFEELLPGSAGQGEKVPVLGMEEGRKAGGEA